MGGLGGPPGRRRRRALRQNLDLQPAEQPGISRQLDPDHLADRCRVRNDEGESDVLLDAG